MSFSRETSGNKRRACVQIILHERMKSLGARVRFEYLPRSMHVSLMLGVAFGSMSPYHAAQSTDILGSIRKHADQWEASKKHVDQWATSHL